jgi:hypothetical protein
MTHISPLDIEVFIYAVQSGVTLLALSSLVILITVAILRRG